MSDQAYDINEVQDLIEGAVNGLTRHFVTVEAVIDSVDETGLLCDVDIQGATFFDVPIAVEILNRASVFNKPMVGSPCLLMFRDGNLQRPQLLMCSKADVHYNDTASIIYQGGKNGGVPMSPNLVTRLNNIENLLNNLITLYNTHTHPVTAVGEPTGPTPAQEAGTVNPTVQKDIENPNFSQ